MLFEELHGLFTGADGRGGGIWDRTGWAEYLSHLEEEADATADELAAS